MLGLECNRGARHERLADIAEHAGTRSAGNKDLDRGLGGAEFHDPAAGVIRETGDNAVQSVKPGLEDIGVVEVPELTG